MARPKTGTVIKPSKEELQELYSKHTDIEISRKFGVSDVAVSLWRRNYGIPTINLRQRQEIGGPSIDDLTPAKLEDLYSRMGDGPIAATHGVTKPTIRNLRLKWGIQPISKTDRSQRGLPKDLRDRSKSWSSLDPGEKEDLLGDLVAFWSEAGFPYPEAKSEELLVLTNLDSRHVLQGDQIVPRQVGQVSCQSFMPHIWEARSFGSTSPKGIFDDPSSLSRALRVYLDSGRMPTASGVRGALRFWKRSGVYNFRPSAAKVLTDRFCPAGGLVYDPCAGYGGRMMGVLASGAQARYVACEPSSDTYASLLRLRSWISEYLLGSEDRASLNCIPAEEFDPPEGIDVVLTSPPYWKRELYSTEDTQSSFRYPEYSGWLREFWGEVLRRSVAKMNSGGWLLLNVDDFNLNGKLYSLVEDTARLVAELGFSRPKILEYSLPGGGSESVLCWCRAEQVLQPDPHVPLEVCSCRSCGKLVSVSALDGGRCSVCLTPRGIQKTCEGCGQLFLAKRSSQRFHDPNCYARYRRRLQSNPKKSRTFTCRSCGRQWETELPGNFFWCDSCREERDKQKRSKTCAYRGCGQPFLDTSRQNSARFCCPKHRGAEKRARLRDD